MNAEPQKFFVGLIDLFSIWLPGALLVYALKGDLEPCLTSLGYPPPQDGIERWAVFLFASYLAGHFVFLVGSFVLDGIDSRIRKAGYDRWKQEVRRKRPPPPNRQIEAWKDKSGWWKKRRDSVWTKLTPVTGRLSRVFFDEEDWGALDAVAWLKSQRLSDRRDAVNSFQWSKARLALGHPDALAIVQRHEADSKFFRSLCVVLVLLGIWWLFQCRWALAAAAFVLVLPAAWRFVHLRAASTSHAYWLVLTLETSPPPGEAGGQAGSS